MTDMENTSSTLLALPKPDEDAATYVIMPVDDQQHATATEFNELPKQEPYDIEEFKSSRINGPSGLDINTDLITD